MDFIPAAGKVEKRQWRLRWYRWCCRCV